MHLALIFFFLLGTTANLTTATSCFGIGSSFGSAVNKLTGKVLLEAKKVSKRLREESPATKAALLEPLLATGWTEYIVQLHSHPTAWNQLARLISAGFRTNECQLNSATVLQRIVKLLKFIELYPLNRKRAKDFEKMLSSDTSYYNDLTGTTIVHLEESAGYNLKVIAALVERDDSLDYFDADRRYWQFEVGQLVREIITQCLSKDCTDRAVIEASLTFLQSKVVDDWLRLYRLRMRLLFRELFLQFIDFSKGASEPKVYQSNRQEMHFEKCICRSLATLILAWPIYSGLTWLLNNYQNLTRELVERNYTMKSTSPNPLPWFPGWPMVKNLTADVPALSSDDDSLNWYWIIGGATVTALVLGGLWRCWYWVPDTSREDHPNQVPTAKVPNQGGIPTLTPTPTPEKLPLSNWPVLSPSSTPTPTPTRTISYPIQPATTFRSIIPQSGPIVIIKTPSLRVTKSRRTRRRSSSPYTSSRGIFIPKRRPKSLLGLSTMMQKSSKSFKSCKSFKSLPKQPPPKYSSVYLPSLW